MSASLELDLPNLTMLRSGVDSTLVSPKTEPEIPAVDLIVHQQIQCQSS